MQRKLYRVTNELDYETENKIVHEYNIIVDENEDGHKIITLARSHDDIWNEPNRGEVLITIIDTGNGYIYPKKMFSKNVDYALHCELFILLNFINKTERFPLYKGSIEEVSNKSFEI